jgi:hypothetical protein
MVESRVAAANRARVCRMLVSPRLASCRVDRMIVSLAPESADRVRASYATASTMRRDSAITAPVNNDSCRASDIR